MGTIGNCCCTCYVPDNYELPTITKSGWTTNSWSGTCCKCIQLVPNTELPWNECCSSEFFNQTFTTHSVINEWIQQTVKPLRFDGSLPFPGLDSSYFCPGSPFIGVSWDITRSASRNFKISAGLKYTAIEVCVSKQNVTCGSSDPVEKWVIVSRYQFIYRAYLVWGTSSTSNRTADKFSDCIVLESDANQTCSASSPIECDFTTVDGLVNNGIPNDVNATLLKSGIGYFTRVKFYDTIPTGTVTFSNADVPGDCVWESCGESEDYDDQFCLSVSSVPGLLSCGCNQSCEAEQINITTPTTSTCNYCVLDLVPVFGRATATYCDGDTFDLQCVDCSSYLTCSPSTWTRTSVNLDALAECEVIYASPACDNYDDNWMSEECLVGWEANKWRFKTFAESSACYWSDPCGGQYPLYQAVILRDGIRTDDLQEYQMDFTCNFFPASCCFSAPSWSVTFS